MSFGRNQKIALLLFIVPFATSTAALFLGHASFLDWSEFAQTLTTTAMAAVLGGSAVVKGARAFAAAPTIPEAPTTPKGPA